VEEVRGLALSCFLPMVVAVRHQHLPLLPYLPKVHVILRQIPLVRLQSLRKSAIRLTRTVCLTVILMQMRVGQSSFLLVHVKQGSEF